MNVSIGNILGAIVGVIAGARLGHKGVARLVVGAAGLAGGAWAGGKAEDSIVGKWQDLQGQSPTNRANNLLAEQSGGLLGNFDAGGGGSDF